MVMNIAQSPAPSSQPRRWVRPGVLAIFYQKEIWQNKRQDVFVKQEQPAGNLLFRRRKYKIYKISVWTCHCLSGPDLHSVNLVVNKKFNEYLADNEGKQKIDSMPVKNPQYDKLYPIVHLSSLYLSCSCYSTSLASSPAPSSLSMDLTNPCEYFKF